MTNSYAEKEAIEKWNNRKPAEEVVERLEEELKKNEIAWSEAKNVIEEDRHYYRMEGYNHAIEIVKEGMG